MFEAGLEKEIEYLRNMGFTKDSPAMKAIGYSEFFRNDCMDLDGIKSLIKFNTKRYAKKQYTFMKGILVVEKIRGFISAGDPVTRKEFFPEGWLL